MVLNFTCTTPPDLRPHIDIKAALPTVLPLKERCLETEGKQWETNSSANKVATKELTSLCIMGSRDGVELIALASHLRGPGSIKDSWPWVG